MLRRTFLTLAASMLLVTALGLGPATAQSLDALRSSGAVGERYDGLLAARDNTAGTRQFVESVNAQRLNIYRERATAQGVSPEQVGRVYAREIRQSAPRGTWFLQDNGAWTQ
ncbi:MAG: YdbL family protein [Minwuia sp.]|nr:YdbL family protein [Minwuia sp.]